MNKYLNKLRKNIKKYLSKEECSSVIEYYTEYFEDAGLIEEADIEKEFGTADILAKRIIDESKEKQAETDGKSYEKRKISMSWIILIAVLGSPLWLVIFCILLGISLTFFILGITFGTVGICVIISGVLVILAGIITIFTDFALGILMVGIGCLCGFIGFIFIILMLLIVQFILKICKKLKK